MYQQIYDKIKNYIYYILIVVVSFCSTAFLPFIGSTIDINFVPPQNAMEWLIYFAGRLIISGINVGIYYCFTQQAIVNVRDNENYKKACAIMTDVNRKRKHVPRSPSKFIGMQWATKGTTVFLSSAAATFMLTGIVLRFDIMTFLVYAFTVLLAVAFGIMTMKNHEYYWANEFYEYALIEQMKIEDKKEIHLPAVIKENK